MQETQVSETQEDPLEEGMATHPVFLPGESHGQRSLAGCSPWGCKESDTSEVTKQQQLGIGVGIGTGFPGGASGKEPACQGRRCRRLGFDPWLGKIP